MGIPYSVRTRHKLLKQAILTSIVETRTKVSLAHKIHGKNDPAHGSSVLVLHGLLGSKKNWDSMSKKIAAETQKRVIAVDVRNHGESPHYESHTYPECAADVSELMHTLSEKAATLIGHSMGGRTAMVLALNEPSKVNNLIIVDISPVSTAGILNDFFPRLLEVMESIEFKEKDIASARAAAKEKLEASKVVGDLGTMNFVLMNVGKRHDQSIGWVCNIDALKTFFTTIASFPSEMAGKQYTGPTLFIAGDKSNYVPPADITGIRDLFPKAELKYVPGAGHNVHAEAPDTFLSLVTRFISENK